MPPTDQRFILQEVDPTKPPHRQLQIVESRPTLTSEANTIIKRDGEAVVTITISGFDDAEQAAEFADKINDMNWSFVPPEAEEASFAPPDTIQILPPENDEEEEDAEGSAE